MNELVQKAVNEFAVELANTRKFLQFYPANNLKVRTSINNLGRSFERLVRPDRSDDWPNELMTTGVRFTVERRHLYFHGTEIGKGFAPISRLAQDLYKMGVKDISFTPSVTRAQLHRFLDVACLKPMDVRADGGIESVLRENGVEGIFVGTPEPVEIVAEAEPVAESTNGESGIDMLGYLRSAQALRTPADAASDTPTPDAEATADISELSDFFADVLSGSEDKVSYLMQTLADPRRLAETLEHIHGVGNVPTHGAEDRSVEVLRRNFLELINALRNFPEEMRADYVRNIGLAILGTSSEVQEVVVKEALPERLVNDPSAGALLATLPDAEVAEALLQCVRFHQGTSGTIANFLDEYATDPRRRAGIAQLLTRLSADDDRREVAELVSLLQTDASHGDAPAAERYMQGSFEVDEQERHMIGNVMDLYDGEISEIEEEVEADCRNRIPQHAARTLLELYITPTIEGVSKLTSERLTEQLIDVLESGNYEYFAEVLRVTLDELPEPAQVRIRPELETTLAECGYPQHMNRLLSRLRKADTLSQEYEQLLYLLCYLGDRAVEHVFLRLEMETSRPMRMFFLGLFREFGDQALSVLNRKVRHRDWFVARNAVHILGTLGSPVALDSLLHVLDHPDMRVRREAVHSIANIGGNDAEDILLSLLEDEEPGMRRVAAERLGTLGCARALPIIRRQLDGAESQDVETLIGLVRAVAALGDPTDVERVRRALPRVALWGGDKKRELNAVGREAMGRLEAAGAGVN